MPHLHVDHSPGLAARCDLDALMASLHGAMLGAGIFPTAGLRVRFHAADRCLVADGLPGNNYLAMTLSVGAGRSKAELKAAGDRIFAAAQAALADPLASPHFALSLEIREIDPDLSWKDTPIHARLSGQSKD